ncbi:MAG TPA: glycosyltransferase family 9 protein [Planctomycetota bacterium]|nr:glycosyltransferase family 9 protein [Planctomycetota bacterium]
MRELLIIKTAALGDVLRTTSILPGLHRKFPGARVTWATAPNAVDLVRTHPLVAEVAAIDPKSPADLERAAADWKARAWDWVLSFDDEEPLCRLASSLSARKLSGAYQEADGALAYTADVAPWFDMGLLSVHGKQRADELKVANRLSHPAIFASMLGLAMGKPLLPSSPAHAEPAARFAREHDLGAHGPVIGLNTGAGGRWRSKTLSPERTVDLASAVAGELGGRVTFLLFGGPDEALRNAEILERARGRVRLVDAGCDNALLDFAARVSLCRLLVTSDSLALHIALARDVRVVAFFAPTSAAEIETYELGEKVASLAPDSCSYRADADTSTLTTERLTAAVLRQLAFPVAGVASPENAAKIAR